MVFHLFERFFAPENFKIDFDGGIKKIQAEGFSRKDAENIHWLQLHQNKGKVYGTLIGLFALYTSKGFFGKIAQNYIPRIYYQRWFNISLKMGTIFFFYKAGDYMYTSRRYGANNKFSNLIQPLLNNREYILNKEKFMQEFDPLNRKFTDEEISIFLNNDSTLRPRKWIYNPFLHGDDEQQWQNRIDLLYKNKDVAPWDLQEIKQKIIDENKEKIESGEILHFKPFIVSKTIDKTGVLHGQAQSFLKTQWTLLI